VNTTEVFQISASIIVALGGGGAIVAGLSSWLGKLWAEKLLERTRDTNQRSLEAHKRELELSFNARNRVSEAEFEIYRDLWKQVSELTSMGIGIRNGLQRSSLSDDEQTERYKAFQNVLRNFELSLQSHKPFFAPEVYDAIQLLAIHVSVENKRATADHDLDGMDLGISHMHGVIPILEASEAVCVSIRQRIYPELGLSLAASQSINTV
jgi:hypothetical protein